MIEETLETVEESIEEEDKQAVAEYLDDLVDAFDQRRSEAEAVDAVANELRYHQNGDDGMGAVEQYAETFSETSRNRMQVQQAVIGYLTGETTKEKVLDAIQNAREVEARFTDEMETVSEQADEIEIPPTLSISGPRQIEVPKGTDLSEQFQLNNYGGESDESVELSVETGLEIEVVPEAIDTLDADDSVGLTIEGSPTEVGVHNTYLHAEGEEIRTTIETAIAIGGRSEYIEKAREQITTRLEFVRKLKPDAPGSGGGLNGVENKFETADKRLSKIKSDIGEDDPEEIADRLDAVGNLLETIPGHVRAIEDIHVPEGQGEILVQDTKAVIETIETAIDAVA